MQSHGDIRRQLRVGPNSRIILSGGVASGTILSGGSEVVSAHGTDFAARLSGGAQFVLGVAIGSQIVNGAQAVK